MNNYDSLSKFLLESDINVGDMILVGKWKNKRAIVKKFTKDKKNNQPQVVTDVGTYSLYNFRLNKYMPEKKKKQPKEDDKK